MKWLLVFFALLLPIPAQAQLTATGVGGGFGAPAGGGPYTGPGDVVSGATAWYGLRAYNASYATGTNPAVDLVDQAGANTITINILANGALDLASISAWVTAHSVTTILVTKLYDQTGNAHHVAQTTVASMPTLNTSGLGAGLPTMVFSGGQFDSASFTLAQPLSYSAAAVRVGTADGGVLAGINGNDAEMRFGPSAPNQIFVFSGSAAITQVATDGTWHALQGVLNGASSVMNVNGTSGTTGASGTNGITAGGGFYFGRSAFGDLTGSMTEGGVWPFAFTGANMTALSGNQRAYWGF
jgi:hypothetical protein